MLKPYVCVACEKVILDHPIGAPFTGSGVPSLISLFNKIIVSPRAREIPADAAVPMNWVVFSSWDTEPGDEEKQYFICTQILYPDNSAFGEAHKTKMNIQRGQRSQVLVRYSAFPIGKQGFYKVQTWVEESGSKVVGPIEFKLEIEYEASQQSKAGKQDEKENAPHNAGRIS